MTTTLTTTYGPEYHKIQTLWKRDKRNVIVPGEFTTDELKYLKDLPWRWSEKIDGTNIRAHWDGRTVTLNGRTDNAQLPARLVETLAPLVADTELWSNIFGTGDGEKQPDVTIYGEGYGAGIQKGGVYGPDQKFIVFDVLIDGWWLQWFNVVNIAYKLGLEVVPVIFDEITIEEAWEHVKSDDFSTMGVKCIHPEGLVGSPTIPLFDRKGERVITKMKVKDWSDYLRKGSANDESA